MVHEGPICDLHYVQHQTCVRLTCSPSILILLYVLYFGSLILFFACHHCETITVLGLYIVQRSECIGRCHAGFHFLQPNPSALYHPVAWLTAFGRSFAERVKLTLVNPRAHSSPQVTFTKGHFEFRLSPEIWIDIIWGLFTSRLNYFLNISIYYPLLNPYRIRYLPWGGFWQTRGMCFYPYS